MFTALRTRTESLVMVLWAATIGALCVRVVLRPATHTVFPVFAAAGRSWIAGEDLYSHVAVPVTGPFRYSPLAAAIFALFSLPPTTAAEVLWRLVETAIYLGALKRWLARGIAPRLSSLDHSMVLLLVLPLSFVNLRNGQTNLIVIAMLLAAVVGVIENRWRTAAACVGIAVAFKIYPLVLGLLFAALYPASFILPMGGAILAILAMPFVLQRPRYAMHQYIAWLKYLRADDRSAFPLIISYRDFGFLFRRAGHPIPPDIYLAVQLAAAGLVAGCCIAARRGGLERRDLMRITLALACCWMLLFGPATESSTYILLAPSIALELVCAARWHASHTVLAAMSVSYGLLMLDLIGTVTIDPSPFVTAGLQPLAALIFMCAIARQSARGGLRGPPSESAANGGRR